MGCLKFLVVVIARFPVGFIVGGIVWFVQGAISDGLGGPLDIGHPLVGGVALILVGLAFIIPGRALQDWVDRVEARAPLPQLDLDPGASFGNRLAAVFKAHNYAVQKDFELNGVQIGLVVQGRQWFYFVPALVWYYVFFFEDGRELGLTEAKQLNSLVRAHTNHQYLLPPAFRLQIPMTATVFVSSTGFDYGVIEFATKTKFTKGGDANEIYLLDLAREQILRSEKRPANGWATLDIAYKNLVNFADLAQQ